AVFQHIHRTGQKHEKQMVAIRFKISATGVNHLSRREGQQSQ
ncbi:hypothetical protein CCACVL1_09271, partial [Corchorus capsularis]